MSCVGPGSLQYDAGSRMTTYVSPIGRKEMLAYDKDDRLTTQVYETSAGTKIATIVSAWDAVGRKTVETKNGTPAT